MRNADKAPDVNEARIRETWRAMLVGEDNHARQRHFHRLLPGAPRCPLCFAPLGGAGGFLMRLFKDIRPSRMNPRYCNDCETFARQHPGGAEVDLAMVFADVRGSTTIAEQMPNMEFARLINRFYRNAGDVIIRSDGLIEKLLGDQLAALYLPGYSGVAYPRRALMAAIEILQATGHGGKDSPWLPVGIGVHAGRAYVGTVGSEGSAVDITALGDDVNIAARLCAAASPGEILVSEAAFAAADMPALITEEREIELRGRSASVRVRVIRQGPRANPASREFPDTP